MKSVRMQRICEEDIAEYWDQWGAALESSISNSGIQLQTNAVIICACHTYIAKNSCRYIIAS
ncbi:uncharacterized protein MYCFIDRAFT_180584 [Pseudocercospora fijiensis CIRAD86]|uniref:Uncharacterized protein n=1 Tax=Pseudocercospora fijiensis (strain CIRAD86) TaxID=383855 RepID=M2ZXT3_PSEFD|nr:uncharacterized protein MYCFIDRAFT_180584 [Pseudocercospora fijiensis CIRAD86]EME76926.1 hypothetical protein MYCFIDRAFT_180584 [Pseudocercospora fijiensis CIRAD86]